MQLLYVQLHRASTYATNELAVAIQQLPEAASAIYCEAVYILVCSSTTHHMHVQSRAIACVCIQSTHNKHPVMTLPRSAMYAVYCCSATLHATAMRLIMCCAVMLLIH
jgi:hypothetical protein